MRVLLNLSFVKRVKIFQMDSRLPRGLRGEAGTVYERRRDGKGRFRATHFWEQYLGRKSRDARHSFWPS